MIEITVKLQLDENSSDAKSALAALFGLPNFSSCHCLGTSTEEPAAKPEATKPEATKPEDVILVPQPQPKTNVEAKKSYKTEDVRAAMASKLADHRIELVNKLKDMGAKNVSSLPEDKYEEFINYCNSL